MPTHETSNNVVKFLFLVPSTLGRLPSFPTVLGGNLVLSSLMETKNIKFPIQNHFQ